MRVLTDDPAPATLEPIFSEEEQKKLEDYGNLRDEDKKVTFIRRGDKIQKTSRKPSLQRDRAVEESEEKKEFSKNKRKWHFFKVVSTPCIEEVLSYVRNFKEMQQN